MYFLFLGQIWGFQTCPAAIDTVFHEECESAVRNDQILHPEEKIKKNQPTGVSISYRKISYYMSPPYNSLPQHRRDTRIGGNGSHKPPGAPQTLQDPGKKPKTYILEPEIL